VIRAAIIGRRDDIATMRLVGASGWMVRGPFVIFTFARNYKVGR